jgi:hypothetical protein
VSSARLHSDIIIIIIVAVLVVAVFVVFVVISGAVAVVVSALFLQTPIKLGARTKKLRTPNTRHQPF